MIEHQNPRRRGSLAKVLDRLLEQGVKKDPPSFRKLAEAAQLNPSRDFIGASLRNIDMRDEDLRGFDFSNADLTGADFRRANVQGARFNDANLTGVIGLYDAAVTRGKPQVLDLGEVLSDLGMLLKRLIGEKVTLEVVHGRDLWPAKVDISQIEQVIVNLVVNARDAMPNGGTITVRTGNLSRANNAKLFLKRIPRGDYVMVEVTDTGIGIPPKISDKIFLQGFRGLDRLEKKGSGLGLFVANEYVKQMNGFISFISQVGRGTTFTVLLPRYVPDIAETSEAATLDPPQDFDLTEVHRMILAGQAVPKAWLRFVFELNFSYEEPNRLDSLGELTNLQRLDLKGASVIDVTPLARLTNLRRLNLSYTRVTSVMALARLVNLENLDLTDTEVRDVAALAGLKHLQILNLSGTQVRNLSPLAELVNLQLLDLMDTHVSDVAALARLTKLKSLDLSHTKVSDVSPLAYLANLQFCNLSVTSVNDVSVLAQLTKLRRLFLSTTSVGDLSPLARLTELNDLSISLTPVIDLSPLARLTKLKSLDLSHTNVSDVSPLAGLTKLKRLNVADTKVNDVSALAHIRGLKIQKKRTR